MKRLVKYSTILVLGLLPPAAYAGDITAPAAVKPAGTAVLVAGGAGNQVDPHVSGTLVAYTAQPEGRIHYVDLADKSDNTIPGPPGTWDALPDVSGNTIVFRHGYDDNVSVICAYDVTSKTTVALDPPADPQPYVYRVNPRIGGRTVVWQERFPDSTYDDIVAFDLDTNVVTRLTNDDGYSRWPSVSPDGSTVVWTKLIGASDNQLWQATHNPDGTWTTKQLTTSAAVYSQPDTNGEVVLYSVYSPLPEGGYENALCLQPVGGGAETRIVLSGVKSYYKVSRHLIVFTRWTWTVSEDVYAYDYDTNTLYQITDTPERGERLDDVSVDADGTARVVWNDGTSGELDVLAFTFHLGHNYSVQPLFDQARSYKVGGVVPIRVQLLDAQGNNVSSSDILLSATGLVPVGGATPSDVVDAGNSNPDSNFRYDATLAGYVFNLSTKDLAAGAWELRFMAGPDASPYSIRFNLR